MSTARKYRLADQEAIEAETDLSFVDFPEDGSHRENVRVRAMGKKQLANLYQVDVRTLLKWINRFGDRLEKAGYQKTDRVFTPRQVQLIFQFLGEP